MWPWDEEQTAVDALRESSAPSAATGGAGDWMTALPMLLGAGASIASPNMANAGNAVMQMGDYFRRQQGADLAQQRYQSSLAQQQQANEMARRRLEFEQAKQVEALRRQAAQRNAIQQGAMIRGQIGTAPDLGVLQQDLQGALGMVEDPAAATQMGQTMKDLQEAQAREQEATLYLRNLNQQGYPGPTPSGATLDTTPEGAPEITPQRFDELRLAARVGAFKPGPAEFAALGLNPLAAAGGPKYTEERSAGANQMSRDALEININNGKNMLLKYPGLAKKLAPVQLRLYGLMAAQGGDVTDLTMAAALAGGEGTDPLQLIFEGRAQDLENSLRTVQADRRRGIVQAETGPLVARHAQMSAIDTTADYQRAANRQPLEIAKQRALAQATVDIHQDTPITDPSRLRAFMDRTTLRVPPAGVTPRQLQSGQWIARPENFQEKTFFVTNGHIETLLKHVLDTGKEYYPPSTGNPGADLVNTTQAAAMYKIKARNTRLAGQQDKIQADLTLFARNAGDVGNIAIVEAARQASGLALGGGVTRERALGALLSARKQSEMLAAQYGIELPPLEPGLQKQITEFEDTQRRREDAAAKAAATGAKGGFETPRERRRQRGAATSSGDPLLDAATGVK